MVSVLYLCLGLERYLDPEELHIRLEIGLLELETVRHLLVEIFVFDILIQAVRVVFADREVGLRPVYHLLHRLQVLATALVVR